MKVFSRDRMFGLRLLLVLSLVVLVTGNAAARTKKKHPPAAKNSTQAAGPIVTREFGEPQPPKPLDQPVLSGQALDLSAPVQVVVSPPLSEIPPIPWYLAPAPVEIDTPLPPEPTIFDDSKPTFTQNFQGPLASAPTPTGVSWDGVGVGLSGFSPTSNPPDTEGRVGATQYVQWNNTSFAVFDKTTGALLYGPAAGNTLFQPLGGLCASHNDGDPLVSYDVMAGRWVISQFVVSGGTGTASHQCIAVSVTQDATGAYYLYDFVTDTTNFIDYPKIGVWPDGYYMSAHIFNAAGTSRTGARVYVFERTQMIQGLPARMQQVNLPTVSGSIPFGFLPADLDSLTPPPTGESEFILGPHPTTTNTTVSWRLAVTWGATPTIALSATATIAVGSTGTAPCVNNTNGTGRDCVPQPAPALATDDLDRLVTRYMYRLAYRNFGGSPIQESLVTTITVQGSPTGHGALRWFEFRNAGSSSTTPTAFQAATFDPDTAYRWLGSAAMDSNHDIALGYSKSSTSILPGMYITGRLGTDTINTMGAEATVQAGQGVQMVVGANNPGNRWGDYADMTLDPVDQCTFYYTNEYLKSNGAFNWSTRVASYKFPACTPAAAWGTVSGTITSCATGAPISGVTVTLSNGFAAASNASGVYSILVPAGSYTATAANAARNCTSSTPSSASVSPVSGGTTTQNFCMNGASNLLANGLTFDDSTGNGNNVINSNECVGLTLNVKNAGCATETAISGTLTTTTAGVTIIQPTSTYPNLAIDQNSNNATQFRIQTSNSFVCGTTIALALNLTYAGGSKTVNYTVHTCEGGPSQSIPSSQVLTTNSSQPDRLGRVGTASPCAGRACPGPINTAGTRNYKTFTFFNNSGSAECFTATINAALGGGGDIEVAAYQNSYTPPVAQGDAAGNLCLNYLGDTGIVGLGTTVGTASFQFTAAANANFVIVVSTATGSTNSSVFSGTVSGFVTTTPGPGPCVFCSGKPNGTACDDGNACTQTDTCQNNVCVGSNPVVCTADQCHDPGTCNPGSGTCSAPTNKPNGTACNDGNACTSDACNGGVCVGTANGACGASGSVSYYRSNVSPGTEPTTKPVPNVAIDANNDTVADATTDSTGAYSIPNLAGHVTLAPLAKYGSPRASDHNGAISSLDASLIARTAVGAATMSPNQTLAGDVSGNGTITGFDAAQVARFAAELVDHFDVATSSGSDWKFLRCDAYAYPGNPGCGPATYDYNPITGTVSSQNFYAVLYGEVTGNWQPAGGSFAAASAARETSPEEQAAAQADRLLAEQLRQSGARSIVRAAGSPAAGLTIQGWTTAINPGERRQLTIDLRNADGIVALDLALKYDPTRLAIVDVAPTGIASGFNLAHADQNGTHRISAYGVLPLSGGGSVLTVTVQALKGMGPQLPVKLTGTANEGQIPVHVGTQQRTTTVGK